MMRRFIGEQRDAVSRWCRRRIAALLAVLLGGWIGAARADTVETVDGATVTGRVETLSAESLVVSVNGQATRVPIDQVVAVTFDRDVKNAGAQPSAGGQRVVLRDGTVLVADSVTIAKGQLVASAPAVGAVTVPIAAVASLWRPQPGEAMAELQQRVGAMKISLEENDAFVVRSPTGDGVVVPGLVEGLDKQELVFRYAGQETAMGIESLAAILFADGGTAVPTAVSTVARVHCGDGSILVAATVALDADNLVATSPTWGKVAIRRGLVDSIRYRSSESVHLSDLEPVIVEATPYFDDAFGWRRNETVTGRRLMLRGTTHEKGLGLHARCRLVFNLEGRYDRLTAIAGIDDAVRTGQAVLRLVADGKPLLEGLVLDRQQAPEVIAVNLDGANQLEVVVDFAEGSYGNGARVNLCGLRLTPRKGSTP